MRAITELRIISNSYSEHYSNFIIDVMGLHRLSSELISKPNFWIPNFACTCPKLAINVICRLIEVWYFRPYLQNYVLALSVLQPLPWIVLWENIEDWNITDVEDTSILNRQYAHVGKFLNCEEMKYPELGYLTWMCIVLQEFTSNF
jgi:hypothetical protein